MKKSFFRRHWFFFTTLFLLLLCEGMICKDVLRLYRNKVVQQESIVALNSTLVAKRKGLPDDHIERERRARINLGDYRKFVTNTWGSMRRLPYVSRANSEPLNGVALFFALSDYISWARDLCDGFGISCDPSCTFGVQDVVERGQDILNDEVADLQVQKEQLKLLLSYLTESKDAYLKLVSIKREGSSQNLLFENGSLFHPDTERFSGCKSSLYELKFISFSSTFRKFLKNLYAAELPVMLRSIKVEPNYSLNFSKRHADNLVNCDTSLFSLIIEFIDIPQNYAESNRRGVAIQRKVEYGLTE